MDALPGVEFGNGVYQDPRFGREGIRVASVLGCGNLLLMGQASHLRHEKTVCEIERFAEDVALLLDRVTERVTA
ncbi:hypothetical protein Pd630_LPD13040 (plasmid) [Rhodococcus opacus PD630]|nr:hypothetical protein Pd630_LPD13040 [Rhodococcus opacus PD630]